MATHHFETHISCPHHIPCRPSYDTPNDGSNRPCKTGRHRLQSAMMGSDRTHSFVRRCAYPHQSPSDLISHQSLSSCAVDSDPDRVGASASLRYSLHETRLLIYLSRSRCGNHIHTLISESPFSYRTPANMAPGSSVPSRLSGQSGPPPLLAPSHSQYEIGDGDSCGAMGVWCTRSSRNSYTYPSWCRGR